VVENESSHYPLVAQQARKYLSVCATSVPAEQVNSCGGNLVSDKKIMP